MSGITVDITGALQKNAALLNISKAARRNLEDWSARTVKALKQKANSMQKGYRKTQALSRSIGFMVKVTDTHYTVEVGTGVGTTGYNKLATKYASIQDEGGIIKAKNYWFPKTSGFGVERKGIKKLCFRTKDGKWHMVDQVTIPASLWFTSIWNVREQMLHSKTLNDGVLWKIAYSMAPKQLTTGGTNA